MYDVLVVGAGASGLAAARDLTAAGKRVCLVEARERIGGRIHTLHLEGQALPIELGAEFIHGEAKETFAIVDAAGLLAWRLPDDHWWSVDGKIEKLTGFWQRVARVRARISGPDQSFSSFLRTQRLPKRTRELALGLVEGYHAAHADRISALALKASDEELTEIPPQHRLAGGYDTLLSWLRAGIHPDRCELRLGTTITAIRWKKGEVVAETGKGGAITAHAAILTLPIGVWKAAAGQPGAIRFTPELRTKQKALSRLEVGHVVKVVFRFRERFWEDVNFVQSSDRWMPTWWTTAPARTPLLTGWAGGRASEELLAEGPDALRDRAIEAMGRVFGVERRTLDDLLEASWTYDWQADPFSRGAYSYAAVGGSGAHAELAKPVAGTLFFAGEATSGDETGTVDGAIASGRRAAREVR
jgi:monoamine oxidase